MMSGVKLSPTSSNGNVLLNFEGNVILHGITLDGRSTDATALMLRTGDNYWIDHLTITGFTSDDALSVGRGSSPESTSEVTISNYHAYDTNKGFLAGGGVDHFDTHRVHRITILNSILNADDRNPLISTKGQTHLYNNLVIPTKSSGVDVRFSSIVIAENNVISGEATRDLKSTMIARSLDGHDLPTGHIFSKNNLFINNARSTGSINPDSIDSFQIPYDYTLVETNLVENFVRNNSGAENANFNFTVCE